MRSSKSRSRSKANRPRSIGNIINRVFDSSGPDGKVRGTPQQIIEKYLFLARDAQLSNDRVAAENFLQHAEHYTRLLSEAQRELAAEQDARQSQQVQHSGNPNSGNPNSGGQHNGNQNGGNQNGGNQNGGNQNSSGQSNPPRQHNERNERRDDRSDYRTTDPRDDRGEYRPPVRSEPDDQPAMAAFEPGLPDFVQQPLIVEESTLVETPETRQPRPPRERFQQRNKRDDAPTEQGAAEPAVTEQSVAPTDTDAPRADRSPRRPRGPRKPSASKDEGGGEPREAAE